MFYYYKLYLEFTLTSPMLEIKTGVKSKGGKKGKGLVKEHV